MPSDRNNENQSYDLVGVEIEEGEEGSIDRFVKDEKEWVLPVDFVAADEVFESNSCNRRS